MAGIRIALLGEGGVWIEGRRTAVPRALPLIVGYLLQQPKFSASRDRIAGALWPEGSDAAALHSLASAMWRIRGSFRNAPAPVITTGDRFALHPGILHRIDIFMFERRLERLFAMPDRTTSSWRRRLALGLIAASGTLLEGFEEEWAEMTRQRWRWRRLDALVRLAGLAASDGDWPAVVMLGREVCCVEGLREDAQRLLMEGLARTGNRALALRQYEVCVALLRHELDVDPMPETRNLAQQLRDDAPEGASADSGMRAALMSTRAQIHTVLRHVDAALSRQ